MSGLITSFKKDKHYSEIYDSGLQFSFISQEGAQCFAFALCKDFLQDAIWAQVNKKPVSIHQFSYDSSKNPPLDLETLRLAVRIKDAKVQTPLKELLQGSVRLLNQIEVGLEFNATLLEYGGNHDGEVWVFLGDKRWMLAPPLLSFYTSALRAGLGYTGDDYHAHLESDAVLCPALAKNEPSYLKRGKPFRDLLREVQLSELVGDTVEKNYPSEVPAYSMHNSTGYIAYSQGTIPQSLRPLWKHSPAQTTRSY